MARLDGMTWEFQPENWMDPNFKSHHALQREKLVHRRMVKFNRKKEGSQT